MNQADILKLAETAGFESYGTPSVFAVDHDDNVQVCISSELLRFAELVAQHERERAINACNDIGYKYRCLYKGWEPYNGNEDGRADPYVDGKSDGADECAEAISARNKS